MCLLIWMCGVIHVKQNKKRKRRIMNEHISGNLEVAPIEEKTNE